MTSLGIAQILVFFLIVLAITKPIGTFMYRVFEGERTFLHPIFRPLERLIYGLSAECARTRSSPGFVTRRR